MAAAVVAAGIVVVVAALGLALHAWLSPRLRTRELERRVATLQESLAALSAVLNGAPTGRFEWAAESGLETCSPGLALLLGAPPIVSAFHDLAEYFDEADFAKLGAGVEDLRQGAPAFDLVVRTRGGRVLQARGRPVVGRGGVPTAWAAWFEDITLLRAELDAVGHSLATERQQRARLSAILDHAPVPAWLRRGDLSIDWVNPAYCRAVERDRDTVLRDGIELAPRVNAGQSPALAQIAQQTGESQSSHRWIDVGGRRLSFMVTEAPLAELGTAGFAIEVTGSPESHRPAERSANRSRAARDAEPSRPS